MAKRDDQAKLIADQQATIAELRAQVSEMRAMLEQMRATSAAREAELSAKLEALTRKAFGKKSEKMPSPKDALRKKDQTKADPAATQLKRKDNQARKADLETEVVSHSVPDAEHVCPACTSVDLTQESPKARVVSLRPDPPGGRRAQVRDCVRAARQAKAPASTP